MNEPDRIREEVRTAYGAVARAAGGGCCQTEPVAVAAERLGYSAEELAAAPEGANLGLGCGNPQAIAALKPGETVLDLGSGAGFDCFLAARQVGPTGKVIGVDMTPDMLAKARANAQKVGLDNLDFRLGEIEALPLADASVDAIISNCVINLSPDKARVFREAFRVLRPGGRLAISDVVATAEIPDALRSDLHLYSCCIGGASPIAEIETGLAAAGFEQIRIAPKDESREFIRDWAPGRGVEGYVVSATIEAVRPAQRKPAAPNAVEDSAPPLHPAIVSLVALAANIAANHPKQGLCQVERLKALGVPRGQVNAAIEIARHLRDEAAGLLDMRFDEQAQALLAGSVEPSAEAPIQPQTAPDPAKPRIPKGIPFPVAVADGSTCCTPTPSGQSCC
jgi:SAM-dependent methyltransferase